MELELLKYVGDHWGPFAVLAVIVLGTPAYMAWTYHRTRMGEMRQSVEEKKAAIEEHKAEKADYKSIITGNTEAITKLAGVLERNTDVTTALQAEVRSLKK